MPDPTAWFNLVEGIFWIALACVICYRSPHRALPLWLALFGISDFIEIRTGAWWSPSWLLILKGACLVGIGVCIVPMLRARAGSEHPTDHGKSA